MANYDSRLGPDLLILDLRMARRDRREVVSLPATVWQSILIIITLSSAVTRADCINLYLFVYLLLGRERMCDGSSAARRHQL